jgi:23S rRNA (uracil1939-C5)-methyltransferase
VVGLMGTIELRVTGLAVGGDGVGRGPDGRVVFVQGVAPGDRVRIRLVDERRRFARGQLVAVEEAGPGRVEPPCPEVAHGCGGCGWQHLRPAAQREARRQLVVDALERIGRLRLTEVRSGPGLPDIGFRTNVRCAVADGRAGFRRSRSHEVLPVPACLVAHPLLDELIGEGRFGNATEVTLRCGARTGERLAHFETPGDGIRLPPDVVQTDASRDGFYHEEVAGRRWRISAGSFFQSRPDGAELLVERVASLLPERPGRVLDAYSGVGLLSAAVPNADALIAVESSPAAVADARVNLAELGARVVGCEVEHWLPESVDTVVADPARRGLGQAGVDVVAATGAGTVVLVSCDAGSLGRDAAALVALGYELSSSEVLDLFPHTPHVEVVSLFQRR